MKVDVYWGQALAKAKDHFDAVSTGLADLSWVITVYTPGRFMASEIIMLAFLGFPDSKTATTVLWDLYEKFPAMQKEYEDVKVLVLHSGDPGQLSTSRKPIRTANDIKGVKIRAVAGPPSGAVKRMGAVPIPMPINDIYPSMEKGVMEGFFLDLQGTKTRKLYEVANYFTMVNMYALPFAVVMNKKRWESIPPDLQKQIMTVSGREGSMWWAKKYDGQAEESLHILKTTAGKKVIYPGPAEFQTFIDAGKETWGEYVKKMEAKGMPGQAMFDEMRRLLKKYKK